MEYTYFFQSNDAKDTMILAKSLGEILIPGDIVTLEGDLGVGKTTFTQGIAAGVGVHETVNSPTFTIVKEYVGKFPFFHMDVYRLTGVDEELGLEEYWDQKEGICVIEWASQIQHCLPDDRIDIVLSMKSDGSRQIKLISSIPHVIQWSKGV